MATWKKVLVSGSAIEVANITASGDVSSSGVLYASLSLDDSSGNTVMYDTSTGKFYYTGSYGGGGGGGGIFTPQDGGNFYSTDNTLKVTGSTLQSAPTAVTQTAIQSAERYAFMVSESAHFYNHNAGYPTSNAWKTNLEGSYFNNFDSNTDVSEILRFVAGLLSSSATAPSPNTQTFSSVSGTSTNTSTGTISGRVPTTPTDPTVTYLAATKGFGAVGKRLFLDASPAISTIYKQSSYYRKFTSVKAGSTSVSSDNTPENTQLFGLGELNSGNANPFYVSGTLNFTFEDNNSGTVTATSQSEHLLSQTSFGTSNGVTLGKINTDNPSVIPPAYQDGKFANILSSEATLYNNGVTFSAKEAVGYYNITGSFKITSGSSTNTYTSLKDSKDRIFFADIDTLNAAIATQNITGTTTSASLTLTSGSLSGAPYARTATYNLRTEYDGVFDPLYYYNNASSYGIANLAESTTGDIYNLVAISSEAGGSYLANIAGSTGRVNTANTVYSTLGAARTTADVPRESDLIRLSGSISFNAGTSGATNITATSITPTTFTIDSRAIDRSAQQSDITQTDISVHYDGEFGQPASSGSMAYFGFPTADSDTSTSEDFEDEANRIQLNNNVTTFAGDAWDDETRLGDDDLQVKPGYLVDPGESRRYWYPSSYGNTFKYYIRKFRRTSNIASFTINLGQTLVAWDDTTTANGVSVGLIFESAIPGSHGLTTTRIYDPYYAAGDRSTTFTGGASGTNPFSSNLDYFGINSGVSTNTYTISVANGIGVYMDGSSEDSFYLIVRYKGEPTTAVTNIAASTGS